MWTKCGELRTAMPMMFRGITSIWKVNVCHGHGRCDSPLATGWNSEPRTNLSFFELGLKLETTVYASAILLLLRDDHGD